jgi:hypothetical protein
MSALIEKTPGGGQARPAWFHYPHSTRRLPWKSKRLIKPGEPSGGKELTNESAGFKS